MFMNSLVISALKMQMEKLVSLTVFRTVRFFFKEKRVEQRTHKAPCHKMFT